MEADAPLPLYKVDLDQDGNEDLALNHRSGVRNRYFHYFLYNSETEDYEALGEFPELLRDEQGLYSSEFDGPREVINRYRFSGRRIIRQQ